MKKLISTIFCCLLIFSTNAQEQLDPKPFSNTSSEILKVMEKVADWQLANPNGRALWEWENGTFYAGLMNFYQLHPQEKYMQAMLEMGEHLRWQLKPHPYLADNFAIAQTYIDLYEIKKDPAMIYTSQYVMDMAFYKRPAKPDLRWVGNPHKLDWWSWCDALFMAPPALANMSRVTGDQKYIDEMDRLWRLTHEYLYDKDEHLYYRDDSFFEQRTITGEKVFWSRGNGWVMAGLVGVLEAMPINNPNRSFYEELLKTMAFRILELQNPKGYWGASLLDDKEFNTKETSGTAFYCYALTWGVNQGLLPKKEFEPAIMNAWKFLRNAVEADGKLGYVQLIGVGPTEVKREDTEVYGAGAFLLAGTEIFKFKNN